MPLPCCAGLRVSRLIRVEPIRQLLQWPQRVAGNVEHVAVIGRDDDQGVAEIDRPRRGADGFVERLHVGERAPRVALVVAVVDPAGLDHQEIPSRTPAAVPAPGAGST